MANATWTATWYALDQPLQVGFTDDLRLLPCDSPGTPWTFDNGGLTPRARSVCGTIHRVHHPVLGEITRVDTADLDYTFTLADGTTLVVNAEESPGTIVGGTAEDRFADQATIDWTLWVEVDIGEDT